MGNIAQAGGFGDTRIPSEEDLPEDVLVDEQNNEDYDYSNGVNIRKSKSLKPDGSKGQYASLAYP